MLDLDVYWGMGKMPLGNGNSLKVRDDMEQSAGFVRQYERKVYALPNAHAKKRDKSVYLFIKRAADIVCSLLGLVLLSPLFLLVAVAIKVDSRGPVFYIHKRIGQNGSDLNLYKFRTMAENADELFLNFTPEQKQEFEENYKLDHDPRLTRIGGFLRETSLDELPQMLNILQGNLSVVGPRPLVADEIEKYGRQKAHFLCVKPGLTGNWQVNGRNNTTYEERMALELYYCDSASLWLDIKILLKTVPTVIRKVGAK